MNTFLSSFLNEDPGMTNVVRPKSHFLDDLFSEEENATDIDRVGNSSYKYNITFHSLTLSCNYNENVSSTYLSSLFNYLYKIHSFLIFINLFYYMFFNILSMSFDSFPINHLSFEQCEWLWRWIKEISFSLGNELWKVVRWTFSLVR